MKISKIKIIYNIFLTYSNPWKIIFSRLGITKGIRKIKVAGGPSLYIRAGTTDLSVLNEIYLNKIYDNSLKKMTINPTIIDIGANIGAFSLRAYGLGNNPKVYSFEPESNNFDLLNKNISLNSLNGKIVPIKMAVSKDGKEKILNVPKGKEGASTIYSDPDCKYESKERINSIKLSDFMKERGIDKIDLLKLDCEGAEFEILYSLNEKEFKIIDRIILEYHEYFGTGDVKELKKHLEKYKFNVSLDYVGKLGLLFAEKE